MRKVILILLIIPGFLNAQNYRTDQAGGTWATNTTWEVFSAGSWLKLEATAFPIPTSASGTILVQHNVTVSASIAADQVTIASGVTLTIAGSQIFTIADGAGVDLLNNGSITTTGTLSFAANSTYQHARDGGTIPLANWGTNSTCYVTGIVNTNPTLIPSNAYQNFVWECSQGGTRSLASNLRTVNGNLIINDTGDQELRFGAGTAYDLAIGGDFLVSGNSIIRFTTSANPVNITLDGDFDFSSSSGTSPFKSTGVYNFTIEGSFNQSSGTISMSTGANNGTMNVRGDFSQTGGTITRSGGVGIIVLDGSSGAQNLTVNGTISSIVDLTVTNTNGVSLAGNLSLPSNFTQDSGAGVFDLNGFVMTIDGNLTQTSGTIGVNTTAELILQGSGTLAGALEFTGTDLLRLELNQTGTITSTSSIAIVNLNLFNGTLTSTSIAMAVGGVVNRSLGTITNTPLGSSYNVTYSNNGAINTGAELPSTSTVLNDLTKLGTGVTTLNQALVTINGNLTLTAGTFAVSTNSITLIGNFVSNATLSSLAGSIFSFNGANATLTGAVSPTFNNLNVNGGFTSSTNYRINGNLIIGLTGNINPGTATVSFGGTTVITNNGTINFNAVTILAASTMTAPATTLGIAGNFTSPGTFINGAGTVHFNGTTNLSAVEVYNNVLIDGTVTSTGNFGQTIGGNLIVNGSFNLGNGNLTWTGNGTISGTGTIAVADLSVTGTSCAYLGTGSITLNDDLLGTGSFNSSASTGSVIIAGSFSRFAGTGTKTFNDLSVTGSLTPVSTYTVVGDYDISGSLISGSTVIFAGTNQSLTGSSNSIAFNILTINPGSNLTINPNVTINSNLTINGSLTAAGTVTFVGLTMAGSGTAGLNSVVVGTGTLTTNMNYSIGGNLTVNGTLAAGSGSATFSGSTLVSGAGAASFNNVTITGSLTARTNAEPVITINGNLTNSGAFDGSSGIVSLAGDLVNNGTFNGNSGTFNFNTTNSASTRTITGSNDVSFFNVVIFNKGIAVDVANQLTAPAAVEVRGTLSFGETNSVIDADGSGAAVLRFISSSDNPSTDGRVGAITQAGSSISGNITVQRFVSSENRIYRYISSPVVGATVAQLKAAIPVTGVLSDPSNGSSSPPCVGCISTNPSLFSFNESSVQNYAAFPTSGVSSSAATFVNGRGYSAFFRHTGAGAVGTVVINFRGTNPSSAGISLPVSSVANGYSLVGNPYPSPIVWNAGAGWNRTNIQDGIVVRDNATGIHQIHGTADNFIIAPGQSFWVNTSAAGGGSLTINENAKTTGTYSFYRESSPDLDKLEVQLTKATTGTTDIAQIAIVPQSLSTYDQFDVIKFNNNIDDGSTITEVQDISILSTDAKTLGLNSIPTISCGQVFNVKVTNFVNTGETTVDYTFQVKPTGALKAISWSLFDKYTNQTIDLSINPVYNFTVTNAIAASKASDRFQLKALQAPTIDPSKSIIAASVVCEESNTVLTIQSQPGLAYSAEVNGTLYKNVAIGDGSAISLFIEKEWMSSTSNSIRVLANSGCDQKYLDQLIEISKQSIPTPPTVTNSKICGLGSTTLIASGANGMEFKWYESMNSASPVATGSEFVTPILSDSINYYVSSVNQNGCESDRVKASIAYSDLSKTITIDEAYPVCASESITLSASSINDGGTFEWYSKGGTSPISFGNQLIIPSLQESTSFEVIYKDNSGCESSRFTVEAKAIKYNPQLQILMDKDFVCQDDNHRISIQGGEENTVYHWFDSESAQLPLFEGSIFTTGPLSQTKDYFVSSVNGQGCESSRIKITAEVESFDSDWNIETASEKICREGETEVKITSTVPNASTHKWYTDLNSVNPIFSGLQFTTATLDQPTTYYVSYVSPNGCESKVRKEVKVNVISFSEPFIDTSVSGVLKSNFSTGNQWYLDNQILSGETNKELIVKESGDYDLLVTYQGCEERTGAVNITTIVTGFEDIVKEVSIYPNPVSEILNIKVVGSHEPITCELIDQKGAVIRVMPLVHTGEAAEGQMNVLPYSAGVYFLKITSSDKSITHRVILK